MKKEDPKSTEHNIGIVNESSLHKSIKDWYSRGGEYLQEQKKDGYFIDIVYKNSLIEIQTSNFGSIKKKLYKLLVNNKLKLVYPIAEKKYIVKIDKQTGVILSRRKSPKTGKIFDLFDELLRIPNIINIENFTLEILIIDINEIRCDDDKGSWRRKGTSIVDKQLIEIKEIITLKTGEDFVKLLKIKDKKKPFTNKELAKNLKIDINKARKITWTLRKANLLIAIGKVKNEILYVLKNTFS